MSLVYANSSNRPITGTKIYRSQRLKGIGAIIGSRQGPITTLVPQKNCTVVISQYIMLLYREEITDASRCRRSGVVQDSQCPWHGVSGHEDEATRGY